METNQTIINLRRLWERSLLWQRFIRLPAFGVTVMLPLLGVATILPQPMLSEFIGLVLFALTFHIFAYVLNDVIDLPVDQLNEDRLKYPLVTGEIQPRQALIFALLQFPAALLLTALLGGRGLSYLALLVAFGMLTIYDLWGKLNPYPPVTDFLQGIGWAALLVYGASIVGETLPALTWLLAVAVVLYIMLVNGVYGALRDVPSDLKGNRITASILLGARPDGKNRLFIPMRLKLYMYILQFAVLALFLYPLFGRMTDYTTQSNWVIGSLIFLSQTIIIWVSHQMVQQDGRFSTEEVAYSYVILSLFCFFFLLSPAMTWRMGLAIAAVTSIPFFIYDYAPFFMTWWKQKLKTLF